MRYNTSNEKYFVQYFNGWKVMEGTQIHTHCATEKEAERTAEILNDKE
jgi:hypothetical protein